MLERETSTHIDFDLDQIRWDGVLWAHRFRWDDRPTPRTLVIKGLGGRCSTSRADHSAVVDGLFDSLAQ